MNRWLSKLLVQGLVTLTLVGPVLASPVSVRELGEMSQEVHTLRAGQAESISSSNARTALSEAVDELSHLLNSSIVYFTAISESRSTTFFGVGRKSITSYCIGATPSIRFFLKRGGQPREQGVRNYLFEDAIPGIEPLSGKYRDEVRLTSFSRRGWTIDELPMSVRAWNSVSHPLTTATTTLSAVSQGIVVGARDQTVTESDAAFLWPLFDLLGAQASSWCVFSAVLPRSGLSVRVAFCIAAERRSSYCVWTTLEGRSQLYEACLLARSGRSSEISSVSYLDGDLVSPSFKTSYNFESSKQIEESNDLFEEFAAGLGCKVTRQDGRIEFTIGATFLPLSQDHYPEAIAASIGISSFATRLRILAAVAFASAVSYFVYRRLWRMKE